MKKIFLFLILTSGYLLSQATPKKKGTDEQNFKKFYQQVEYSLTINCSNGDTRTIKISYDPSDPLNTSTMTPDPQGDCPIEPVQPPTP
jgi:hypothetical protein